METKTTSITAFLLLFIVSCSVVDRLLTFTISDESTFEINRGLLSGTTFEVTVPDITTNSSVKFQNNNTRIDLVKDVRLEELKLSLINSDGKTFSFIKSLHIYISTNETDEIELAFQDNSSSNTNTLNLICTSQKLDKYIKAPRYKIRTSITLRETLIQVATIKTDIKFKITADPFN